MAEQLITGGMMMELSSMQTETRNPETLNLDQMSVSEILAQMNKEDYRVPAAIETILPDIERAVNLIVASFKQGGRLIYAGAGTSGRLGVLDAAECVPTFGVSPEMVVGLIAGGEKAMVHAVEGAEDSLTLAVEDLKALGLNEHDTVVGIAASGRTPYVIGALQYAKEVKASTVSLSCNTNAAISPYAEVALEVETGPEILTGSTRLKAGTAQKLVLNMLSTTSMIGVGKVYQNLMVDVQATNEKLVERSKQIIMEATGVNYDIAAKVFDEADQHVKTAIVMLLTSQSKKEAKALLEQADGFVGRVVEEQVSPDN